MSTSEEESGSEAEEVVAAPKKTSSAPKKQVAIPAGLDKESMDLLEANKKDRDRMEEEINELRERAEKRKKQRVIEDKRHAKERADEDERRKASEEDKNKKRKEEEQHRQNERAQKLAEFEKLKNPGRPNFVISKKEGEEEEEEEGANVNRKSKEQLEAEKRAILGQRIQPLQISGFDSSKLSEKAKELHKIIYKLENEKYDLERLFKMQQSDLMELAEQARKQNKVGKGGLKRVQAGDEVDMIQARFTGAPAKIEMYSKYERQKDKREYTQKVGHFSGPQFLQPAERIKAAKAVAWDEEGMPIYGGGSAHHEPIPEAAAETDE